MNVRAHSLSFRGCIQYLFEAVWGLILWHTCTLADKCGANTQVLHLSAAVRGLCQLSLQWAEHTHSLMSSYAPKCQSLRWGWRGWQPQGMAGGHVKNLAKERGGDYVAGKPHFDRWDTGVTDDVNNGCIPFGGFSARGLVLCTLECWHGLLEHRNGAEPSLMALVILVVISLL